MTSRLVAFGGPWRRTPAGIPAVVLLAVSLGCSADAGGLEPMQAAPAVPDAGEPADLRFTGTVEAVRSWTVTVPRLAGQSLTPLVITSLVPAGTRVEPGDTLVIFDRQEQERLALERQAEVVDLDGQIARKQAEQAAEEAGDRTELTEARNQVERARLDLRQNGLVARVVAEKNTLALEEAEARLAALQETFELKRKAAAADLRILEIRRERAAQALAHARDNADRMTIRAPFAGLVVIKRTYRNSSYVEILEGDDVRPGTPIIDIVDTTAMQVRAQVNQADVRHLHEGQPARVGLDGFPSLTFGGRIELVAPLGVQSLRTEPVRTFIVVVSIEGHDPQLLPDLTAWVECEPGQATPDGAR